MSGFNQNVDLDIGALLKEAWDIFTKDVVTWILAGIVGALCLGCGFWGGLQHMVLKARRGEAISVGDVFWAFKRTDALIGFLIFLGVGIVTCGLGAMVLGVLWMWMFPLLAMRENLTWKDAAGLSKDALMANVGPSILVLVVGFALGMVGSVIPFGALVTSPLSVIFTMLAASVVFGSAQAGLSPQQLDYAPGAPAPMGAPPAAYGAPAAYPTPSPSAAPTNPMGPPPAAAPAPAAPAPAAPAPAPAAPAPAAPAPAAPAPAAPTPADNVVETAQQSTTNNPDEIVAGKTIAMSSVDFEKMLKNNDDEG